LGPEVSIPVAIGTHVLLSQLEDKYGKEKLLELIKEGNVPELNADAYGATVSGFVAMDPELISHVTEIANLSPAQQINLLQEYRFATATTLQLFASGKVKDPSGNKASLSGLGDGDPAALAKAIIAIKTNASQSTLRGYTVDGIPLQLLITGFTVSDPTLPKPPG
jgi:hypothetical protein